MSLIYVEESKAIVQPTSAPQEILSRNITLINFYSEWIDTHSTCYVDTQ